MQVKIFLRAELQNTQRVGVFFTFLFLYLVYETSEYSVVFCNLNASCCLSCNANKLPVHKLLTPSCIFISDGQRRVWMPLFKTKRIKRGLVLYPPIRGFNATLPPVRKTQESTENTTKTPKSLTPPPPRDPQGWDGCFYYTGTSSILYQPFVFRFNFKPSSSFFYINTDIRKHFCSGDNSWGCFSLVHSTTCQEYYLFYWRSKLRGNTYFWNKYYFLNSLSNFTTHCKEQK